MGNLCGKSSQSTDAFSQPGRALGSAPTRDETARAPIPARAQGPGRIVGGNGVVGEASDPRSAAAKAAEERAKSQAQPKGKLGEQLAAQKRQTRTDTLEQASKEERRARDADANAQARNWN